MTDDELRDLVKRTALALEALVERVESLHRRLDKENRCPGCLGTAVDYQKRRCYRCGGTGLKGNTKGSDEKDRASTKAT
jgi:rRNA maturation endonuclease Nob1